LTGLLVRDAFLRALDEEGAFCDWAELPMQIALYGLHSKPGPNGERSSIRELLALRQMARRVQDLTESALVSLTPLVAGRDPSLEHATPMVACSLTGLSAKQARDLTDAVLGHVRQALPRNVFVNLELRERAPGRLAREALGIRR
jgi:serine/threonine-protein kinase